ncbi:hydroxyethylthiazole kinase [uncultured Selenomonas sp.]|uniref:hydroxyethylthiazole kinase n=1 Tax=uncultured Selenomonas sp. TaxID=159275 RepID=UPI0028D6CDA8|nr:hydroxyethylthiazole kinase [uncultured Selenomonas sp.]
MQSFIIRQIRERMPLVHCITNYVTVNDVANVLLAVGARPIMADDPAEAAEITALCAGLCLNIGTLNERTIPSMLAAGKAARALGRPVVLDPVGAGASRLRTETALRIMDEVHPAAVRGNISEIRTLAAGSGRTQGVDAAAADAVTEENLAACADFVRAFAARAGTIVAVTGAIDLVTDGARCYAVRSGRPEMGCVTGTGCQLSSLLTAALAAAPADALAAAAAATALMGVAGEQAWTHMAAHEGNASYRTHIIDAVDGMTDETLAAAMRVTEL